MEGETSKVVEFGEPKTFKGKARRWWYQNKEYVKSGATMVAASVVSTFMIQGIYQAQCAIKAKKAGTVN